LGSLIENEEAKYAATFFNSLAITSFAGGCILPFFSAGGWQIAFAAGGGMLAV
jgi:hypothetical protein